ncbi:MAG: PIG-L deacetylase family protein [Dehalococcoidia bacterium]|nr:PIG-L deacetylase family protein [Dehalococcoidia bacterium]
MTEQTVSKVMVIVAHPDDPEFSAGGTIARWAGEGRQITYVICTNGNKGSNDPNMTPDRLAIIREAEQHAAARVLGVAKIVFLGFNDGELVPSLELRKAITRAIRQHRPNVVITSDPTTRYVRQNYINHPDHRAVGDSALDAIYPSARDRLYFPELLEEGLEPHKVAEVYLSGSTHPDTWVDIEATIDTKVAAILQHKSQIGDPAKIADWIKQWSVWAAEGQGITYAEAFKRLILQ